jgi:2'-5' RNA ligase
MSHEEAQKTQKDWRVFCAIELPGEVRARLDDHILRLRKEVPDAAASWSRVENIHLTLKFFGNVEVKRIARISAVTERVVKEFSTFKIAVGETVCFRDRVDRRCFGLESAIRPGS